MINWLLFIFQFSDATENTSWELQTFSVQFFICRKWFLIKSDRNEDICSTMCFWDLLVESNLHLLQIRRQIDVFPNSSSSICANRFGLYYFTRRALCILRAKNQFSKYVGNFNLWMLNPRPCKTYSRQKKLLALCTVFLTRKFQVCWKMLQFDFSVANYTSSKNCPSWQHWQTFPFSNQPVLS